MHQNDEIIALSGRCPLCEETETKVHMVLKYGRFLLRCSRCCARERLRPATMKEAQTALNRPLEFLRGGDSVVHICSGLLAEGLPEEQARVEVRLEWDRDTDVAEGACPICGLMFRQGLPQKSFPLFLDDD